MFERFTERARKVLVLAEEETWMLKHKPHRYLDQRERRLGRRGRQAAVPSAPFATVAGAHNDPSPF
jgi:hypothetical protein